ncbi:MAG: patatin-like phospholipase family protein [Epsilonproteobacteria bacterium]|nr:hypothetical protein [Campylobacterota bacterium]NPA57440.1 patatin-like phospholipase family protein [Campylobacterota bacterium]
MEREPKGEKSIFRILSLDGGGIRGYLTISILERIEKGLNRFYGDDLPIGQRFDLIVGTSTGGIIATALALGKSARETRELYENLVQKIFRPHYKGIIKPKYNQNLLRKYLLEIVGEKTFFDLQTHLCLTSVDIATAKPLFFKSPYEPIYNQRADEKLIDAVLATCAAPIYFPPVDTKYSNFLADGGLVANNPAMVGLIEGFNKVHDLDRIRLLSIGTGKMVYTPYDVNKLKKGGGIFSWALDSQNIVEPLLKRDLIVPLIEILFNAQSSLISYQINILLGKRFFRINPSLPTSIRLDDTGKLGILKNLAFIGDKKETIERVMELLER